MRVREIRLLLWSASGLFAALTLGTVVYQFWWPAHLPPPPEAPESPKTLQKIRQVTATPPAGMTGPPLVAYERLWMIDLRRSVGADTVRSATLGFKILGTIVEPGQSLVIVGWPDGKTEFKAIGERLGNYEILEITEDSVKTSQNGDITILRIDKPETPK